jgi:hypothetical protein
MVAEGSLRMLHWNGSSWDDVTTTLNTGTDMLCGVTTSLSPFVIGASSATAVGGTGTPRTLALHPNVPNPFNPTTTISYDVPPGGANVTIRIYDASGRVVRTLVDDRRAAGTHDTVWDGRNDAGTTVSSGVYFYRMVAGSFSEARRMVLLK